MSTGKLATYVGFSATLEVLVMHLALEAVYD